MVDLCGRLLYVLKVQYKGKTYDLLGLDIGRIFVNLARVGEWLPTVYTFDIKPYLRPMSSMTEEEREEYLTECDKDAESTLSAPHHHGIDWLNAHHFDYRGLIPRGLAIAVTKDNNPYKK